ncbi:amino acid ABC transporter ATP-binding protein [Cellulosilyticum sp. ST5]|uniref:Fe(3+)-transporting ATPase n=1 Tax=Cellulosilyticum lentocellum (strain ATCC 49066 / DSM 5427 / NCIMB 11756 / RHM5) TaxID=642492 RepID=F2JQ67_CELLD|nr:MULTISPECIES: amino acid ABC transporter ATP-binding protein [Cellulosilyticum]ADZ82615.1 Fe(3+)-transporting ATPase [Cellulosilyticum lentocellum DSM 5427]QEH68236.1 amino acid ABC transporter ATP-binding protein [Cellulosilyticum sp. WCF-2]
MAEMLLEIEHLYKSYDNNPPVLKDISFQIQKGEVIVILGPSGCGKSTLLRCLNGLEVFQAGNIKLDGESITRSKKDWPQIRQKIGMVFQSYDLFAHMTVMENILLGPIKVQKRNKEEASLQAEKLLERVGLSDKKDAYPRQLSGGQKQRVAIVRALCMNPEILLFDEVTAALDPEMVREVLDVILELAKAGTTMAIVTHEMKFAKAVADRILFIDQGEIIEENTPKAFFENPSTLRAKQFLNIFNFEEETK